MKDNWRIAQIFLDARVPRVYEVEINQEPAKNLRCSCPQFKDNNRCMHTKYVQDKIVKNNGHYPIKIADNVDESIVMEAFEDKDEFRKFVIKYAKIEVM
jgi:hypothetical protein